MVSRFPLILLLACTAVVGVPASSSPQTEHNCIHDSPKNLELQAEHLRAAPYPQRYQLRPTIGERLFHAEAASPLRIVFSTEDLTLQGRHCANVGDEVPDYGGFGGTATCLSEKDVLSEEKRAILMERVLPAAVVRIQQMVFVQPVVGNLMIPNRRVCGGYTVPPSHITTGVPDADLVVYVSAGPIGGGTAAFAGACTRDQNGRPIAGRLTFATNSLVWNSTDAVNEGLINTAVHELFHILGVTGGILNAPSRTIVREKRRKKVTMVTWPTPLSFARAFTGCDSLEGVEIEDEGGDGTSGSHWERKLFMDELMCAVPGGKVSWLSLGVLHDLNCGYTIDFSTADSMRWGRGTGCGVHDFPCNTTLGGRDTLFCFDEPASPDQETPNRCTFDYRAIGYCGVSSYANALAPSFQYFADPRRGGMLGMDGCPIVNAYSNRQCDVPAEVSSSDAVYGFAFAANSRCFDTTGLIRTEFLAAWNDRPRCLVSRCVEGDNVQFRAGTNAFAACPSQGDVVAPGAGFRGEVQCPDPARFCSYYGDGPSVVVNVSELPAVPGSPVPSTQTVFPLTTPLPVVTSLAPTTTRAPVTRGPGPAPTPSVALLTVVCRIEISGDRFVAIQANVTGWSALVVAVKNDIAAAVQLSSSAVVITGMDVGSRGAARGLLVNFTVRAAFGTPVYARVVAMLGSPTALPETTAQYRVVDPNASAVVVTSATIAERVTVSAALRTTLLSVCSAALWACAIIYSI